MTKLIECDKCGKHITQNAYHLQITEIFNSNLVNSDIQVYRVDLCNNCVNDIQKYIGLNDPRGAKNE